MMYTIGQVAKKMNISAFTLRYYDKEGLLPFVKRNGNGVRIFDESDFGFLRVIDCLKRTGMSLTDIRTFIGWTLEGDASLQKRFDLFQERKRAVDDQIAVLEAYRDCIEYKCRYYEEALKAGAESVHWDGDACASKMTLGILAKMKRTEEGE